MPSHTSGRLTGRLTGSDGARDGWTDGGLSVLQRLWAMDRALTAALRKRGVGAAAAALADAASFYDQLASRAAAALGLQATSLVPAPADGGDVKAAVAAAAGDEEGARALLLHFAALCRCDVARYTTDWGVADPQPNPSQVRVIDVWVLLVTHETSVADHQPCGRAALTRLNGHVRGCGCFHSLHSLLQPLGVGRRRSTAIHPHFHSLSHTH